MLSRISTRKGKSGNLQSLWMNFGVLLKGDKEDTLEMLLRDINVSILKVLFI
jgi:hypothetical protein